MPDFNINKEDVEQLKQVVKRGDFSPARGCFSCLPARGHGYGCMGRCQGLVSAPALHSRCLWHGNHYVCRGRDARLLMETVLGCSFQQGGVPVRGSLETDSGGMELKRIQEMQ